MTDRDGQDTPDFAAIARRTAGRYIGCGRFTRHYVASKLKRDPVHRDLLARAGGGSYGAVLDLGCGHGQVAIMMLEAGLAREAVVVDREGPALRDARRAASGLSCTAQAVDLTGELALPPCDTVLLIDVLYQLGPEAAQRLLAASARAARRRVLVRTLDPGLGWRSALAMKLERLGQLGWPHSGRHVAPLAVGALCAALEAEGFRAAVTPSWQGTPFANVLVDAERR